MFFALSKILTFLLQPSSLIWLACGVGLLLRERSRRLHRFGLWLLMAGLAALLVAGLSPLGNILLLPLESRFPGATPSSVPTPLAGIIVLGGAEDGWVSSGRSGLAVNEAAERITETARLATRHPEAKVVVTGGVAAFVSSGVEGSSAVAALLRDLGIAADRLIVETKSRNTYENASMTLPLINAKPGEAWLLVTSAYHMPRAVGIFRKAGLDVIPYPVDYRLRGPEDMGRWFKAIPEGLRRCDLAVKEWAGLIAYWLTGRTTAFFPAP
ncbi:MAG: YdcF family protein [Hyphomicrobiaceae bacterium]|nr:YdcF family protein [Hyphomicrobiaceae bacterium]